MSSVERHLKTLEARAPELLALYRLVGRDVLRLAQEKAKLDPAGAARIEALFAGNGGNGKPTYSGPSKGPTPRDELGRAKPDLPHAICGQPGGNGVLRPNANGVGPCARR